MSLADLGVDAGRVGLAAAATRVVGTEQTPARRVDDGTVVTDEGEGAVQIADFLSARGLL